MHRKVPRRLTSITRSKSSGSTSCSRCCHHPRRRCSPGCRARRSDREAVAISSAAWSATATSAATNRAAPPASVISSDGALPVLDEHVRDDHLRARSGKGRGDGPADPVPRAGDHGGLAIDACHVRLLQPAEGRNGAVQVSKHRVDSRPTTGARAAFRAEPRRRGRLTAQGPHRRSDGGRSESADDSLLVERAGRQRRRRAGPTPASSPASDRTSPWCTAAARCARPARTGGRRPARAGPAGISRAQWRL